MKREWTSHPAGSLTGIKLSDLSESEKRVFKGLCSNLQNSRKRVGSIAKNLANAIDQDVIKLELLEALSKYCHSESTWIPCVASAEAISKWLTGGMVLPRLLDKKKARVKEHHALCQQIITFVKAHGQSSAPH